LNDIGTIVIYTCKNCCDSKIEGGFVEEHGFIQRTGENFRDFNDNDNKYKDKKSDEEMKKINEENEFFAGVNEKDVDEEGFAEVKKKKNKKSHKNKDEDEKWRKQIKIKFYFIFKVLINSINIFLSTLLGIGDWGVGVGDWGLGIGPNPQSPIPNPQSPIPKNINKNLKSNIIKLKLKIKLNI